jgi:hypothetical protein
VIARTGQDWFHLPAFHSAEDRQSFTVEVRPGGVFRINRIGGWPPSGTLQSVRPDPLPETPEAVDELVPVPPELDPDSAAASGRNDLASLLLEEFGAALYPIASVASPFWRCYGLWGFEGMMTLAATRRRSNDRPCGAGT